MNGTISLRLVLGTIVSLVLLASTAQAGGDNTTLLGRWAYGPSSTVCVVGTTAYTGAGGFLLISDVTDEASPIPLGDFEFPSAVLDVEVESDFAFVATAYSGLFVLDVTDSSAPAVISSLPFDSFLIDLEIAGGHVYLADGVGVNIVDVSDPFDPSLVTQIATSGSATDTRVQGGLAYVSDFGQGLLIYDVGDPTTPQLLGTHVPIPVGLNEVCDVQDGVAYVGDWQGVRTVDVSDPANPFELDFLATGIIFDVEVDGDILYASDGRGVRVFDVSDPSNVEQAAIVGGGHFGDLYYDIDVVDTHLYMADSIEGTRIFDLPTPTTLDEIGVIDARGYSYDIKVIGDLAYVANGSRGLRIIDLSDLSSLEEIGFLETNWATYGIDVDQSRAYMADGAAGLRIVDVANPLAPAQLGLHASADWFYDVVGLGDLAIAANGNLGTAIVDVSDPTFPFLRSRLDDNSPCGASLESAYVAGIDVVGNLVFAAEDQCGLRIIDISDPDNPVTVGQLDTPGNATDVVVDGDFAYLADNPGLRIIDISNPTLPVLRSVLFGVGGNDIAFAEGYAYVAAWAEGVYVVDVSDPEHPVQVGAFDTGFAARGLYASGSRVYVTDGMDGLYVIGNDAVPSDVSLPDSGPATEGGRQADRILLGNAPNPFADETRIRFQLPEPSEVRLIVIDVSGRQVARHFEPRLDAGRHEISFAGEDLPNGVYRYVLQAGARVEQGRMTRVR